MNDERPQQEDPIDVRVLSREKLTHEAFPGGRNEGLRVYFTPRVHEALWQHATADTSVEICGVLVGTWHRDDAGPFVKIVESIRGEGAETKFAEVTFTHQTWAKINAEMDSKFSKLSIVGWYHTHPDFGIFLSDRDRFIHEHFFSGPGQVAHVIDPIRKTEGVFIWRGGKPSLCEHFWVGDRILAQFPSEGEYPRELDRGDRSHAAMMAARPPASMQAAAGALPASGARNELFPGRWRWLAFGLVFILGYLLASIFSAWEHQRFVENVLASNGFVAVLRLGLADELDGLRGDLVGMVSPLDALGSKTDKPEEHLGEIRAQILTALRRTEAIKGRYANTPAEDAVLKRMIREQVQQRSRSSEISSPGPEPAPAKDPAKGDGKAEAPTEKVAPRS